MGANCSRLDDANFWLEEPQAPPRLLSPDRSAARRRRRSGTVTAHRPRTTSTSPSGRARCRSSTTARQASLHLLLTGSL